VTTAAQRFVSGSRDGEVLGPQPVTVPRTRFNAQISPHRRYSYGSLPLDRVKAIKNELGITVNDVVVTLVATAMRTGCSSATSCPRTRSSRWSRVGALAGADGHLRQPRRGDDHADPDRRRRPRERLLKAHDTLAAAKSRHKAVPANLLQDVTQFIPPAVAARAARVTAQITAGVAPPLNLVISNVPGPSFPLYCAGARLEANFPVSVITDGVGLNITCMSYEDHIDFGIVVDRDMVDDAWPLMDAHRRRSTSWTP
jgi:hypothetical protein